MLSKQIESLALKAFVGCDVLPRYKFVYAVGSGLTGFSHCFFFANASTVCSHRVLCSQEILLKRKANIIFYICRYLLFHSLVILTLMVWYQNPLRHQCSIALHWSMVWVAWSCNWNWKTRLICTPSYPVPVFTSLRSSETLIWMYSDFIMNILITNLLLLKNVILGCCFKSCALEIHELKDFVLPSNPAAACSQQWQQNDGGSRTVTLQKVLAWRCQAQKFLRSPHFQTHGDCLLTAHGKHLLMLTGYAKSQKFAVCQVLPFLQELSSIVTFNRTSNVLQFGESKNIFLSVKATNYSHYRWAQMIYFSYTNKNIVSVASDIKYHVIIMLISLAILIAAKLLK